MAHAIPAFRSGEPKKSMWTLKKQLTQKGPKLSQTYSIKNHIGTSSAVQQHLAFISTWFDILGF